MIIQRFPESNELDHALEVCRKALVENRNHGVEVYVDNECSICLSANASIGKISWIVLLHN